MYACPLEEHVSMGEVVGTVIVGTVITLIYVRKYSFCVCYILVLDE